MACEGVAMNFTTKQCPTCKLERYLDGFVTTSGHGTECRVCWASRQEGYKASGQSSWSRSRERAGKRGRR